MDEALSLKSAAWWLPAGVALKQPTIPFHTFLLKIASRCNLDCDYCYIYRSPDKSWQTRPHFMEENVGRTVAQRIAEHVSKHGLEEIDVVFHGGEPLLAGASRIDTLATLVRETISAKVNFGLQTNGTLIDEEILKVLLKHEIRIGLSLDGSESANDRHRLNHAGKSSYQAVLKAIDLIRSNPEWSHLYGGLLAVIDLRNDPVELYRFYSELNARSIDLLLPDFNHDRRPWRNQPGYTPEIAYGQWLAQFFEVWFSEGSPLEIKFFDEILTLLLGGPSGMESIGLTPVDLVIIESDGDIEPVDTLKTASRAATNLGLNVRSHSFDDALQHPAIMSRLMGSAVLCETCQNCPELKNCGGGYIPHRFREANGFLNPSIYCEDLKYLFGVMRSRVRESLAPKAADALTP